MWITSLKHAILVLMTILRQLPPMTQSQVMHRGLKEAKESKETKGASRGGLWLEFGVFTGTTLHKIAAATNATVYGFDSFEGLPETWRLSQQHPGNGFDRAYTMKGSFSLQGRVPTVHAKNAKLVKGWFNATLPQFLRDHPATPITFLHVDCDLYSSAAYVLRQLTPRIRVGTVIVFDELINYPSFEHHEFRALVEWLAETGHVVRVISGAHMLRYPTREAWPQAVALQVVDSKYRGALDTLTSPSFRSSVRPGVRPTVRNKL